MQRYPSTQHNPPQTGGPLVLLFERNDAIAVPLLGQLRSAGYDVRAARIPVEVFDLMQREPIDMVLIDLGNVAANRREFWVGLDTQRRNRNIHILTFRYMTMGETGALEEGVRVARADVEIQSVNGFGPLIEAVRARLPGATPHPTWMDGPPPNLSLPPAGNFGTAFGPQWTPFDQPASTQDFFTGNGEEAPSPFEQPYTNNPFKRGGAGQTRNPFGGFGQETPFGRPQPSPGPQPYVVPDAPFGAGRSSRPPLPSSGSRVPDYAAGFSGNQSPPSSDPSRSAGVQAAPHHAVDDAWTPPPPQRRGIAYRGYEDEPLAPDDPRIEDSTSPVPIVHYAQATGRGESIRNDRALSTILMDSAVIAPQKLDALRSIQQTLTSVGMDFSIGELAMLFRFLTPDQLLAALLVSRGLVDAEQIASLGRIKQELLATGKDYDLDTLLVMFNVLPVDQVRALREELA